MSEDRRAQIRQRLAEAKGEKANTAANPSADNKPPTTLLDDLFSGFSLGFFLRNLVFVLVVAMISSYFVTGDSLFWNAEKDLWWTDMGYWKSKTMQGLVKKRLGESRPYTDEELLKFDGTNPDLPIFVAVNGTVYDVSASPKFYGPGGGYHIFAGRDATRAFVTGCFDSDATPDLRGAEEMFMPLDLDSPPKLDEDATEEEKKAARNEWRQKRKAAAEIGKEKVRATVQHWQGMFESGMGGKYKKIGYIPREEGWEKEQFGAIRTLCKRAQDQRPKTSEETNQAQKEQQGPMGAGSH